MKRLLALVAASLALSSGGAYATEPPTPGMHTLSLTDSQLDEYAGTYSSARSGITYLMSRDVHELKAQIVGQAATPIFASRPDHFFYTTVRAYVQFVRKDGRVVGLVLTQYERTVTVPKLSADGKPLVGDVLPDYPPVVAMDERTLDQYTGTYDSTRSKLSIAESNGHVFAQIAGQEALEIYPSTKGDFYYKAVDALVHFNRDTSGRITSLSFTQNGYTNQYTRER